MSDLPPDHPTGYSLYSWPLYLVGQQLGMTSAGVPIWTYVIQTETELEADAACLTHQHFYVQVRIGVPVDDLENFWPSAVFPRQSSYRRRQ